MWNLWQRARQVLADRLWVRPGIASILAALLSLAAVRVDIASPDALPFDIEKDTLVNLLSMIATSMLTVATFSVAAIVTATTAISQSTTPRVTRLILADQTVQNVLASFISAFIFSLVSIFSVEALPYGPAGRVMIFIGLVGMILWVLVSFLRWVDHVTQLGRVGTAMSRTAEAALEAVTADTIGTFGAARLVAPPDDLGIAVAAKEVGYVLAIDVDGLQDIAKRLDAQIFVVRRPGDVVDLTAPMAWLKLSHADGDGASGEGDRDEEDDRDTSGSDARQALDQALADIHQAFATSDQRTPYQDPRFGIVILSETASKALSPGVNDPGTAIGILTAMLNVFSRWAELRKDPDGREVRYPRVFIPPLMADELADDAFTAIARDGAGTIEVGIRLQKTLQALVRLNDPELTAAACRISDLAMELSDPAPLAVPQHARLRREAEAVRHLARPTRQAARLAKRDVERRRAEADPQDAGDRAMSVGKGETADG